MILRSAREVASRLTRIRRTLGVTLLALISCLSVAGQETKPNLERLDALRAEGYDALYNLDYEGARRRFREMIALAPDHPAGAQCFAASLWLQQLNESWELKATLYTGDSYAGAKSRSDSQNAAEFRDWIKRAKRLSEARLRRNAQDVEALYFLGAAEGLESAFAAAVEHRFMAALRSGSNSVDHHREVLKLAPDFHDAELTLGLYNYIVGSLPLPLKMLVGTMGVRGSKKRGLETLERVSSEGHWARDVARVLLLDIYKREKRWNDAVLVSRLLSERYPRNYLFKLQTADALVAQVVALHKTKQATVSLGSAEEREVLNIYESLLRDKMNQSTIAVDLVHFRYGEALLLLGQPARATKEFTAAVTSTAARDLKTMCRLRIAQSWDLMGHRVDALAEYRAVLSGPDVNQAHEEARRGLREPFREVRD
jgi:hypothetical protein